MSDFSNIKDEYESQILASNRDDYESEILSYAAETTREEEFYINLDYKNQEERLKHEQKQSQQADDQPLNNIIKKNNQMEQISPQTGVKSSEIETAKKAGYVQGVCECVAAVGDDYVLGQKLLTEMKVSKKMAKEYASPETFKALEKGIFAQKQEQKLEHQQKRGHRR